MPLAPPVSGVRQSIVDTARSWVGKIGGFVNGKVKGANHMMDMYREAISGPATFVRAIQKREVADWILEGTEKGLWILKRGWRPIPPKQPGYLHVMVDLPEKRQGVMWCGIFATWMLQKCGLDATWVNGKGIRSETNEVKLEFATNNLSTVTQAQRDNMEIGDVCVLGENQHHVILVDARPGVDDVTVVEGNIPLPRHSVLESHYSKRDFHTHYKIVERARESRLDPLYKCHLTW